MAKAKKLFVSSLASAILALTGCQTAQINYFKNIEQDRKSNFLSTEAAKSQNCLDANTPRTYSESSNKLVDNVSRIPGDLLYVVSRVPALAGLDFANNRYFGSGDSKKGIFSNDNNCLYKNQLFFDKKTGHAVRGLLLHPFNWTVETLGGAFDLVGHTTNSVSQVANMSVILPISANTNERDKIFAQDNNNDPSVDKTKKYLDVTTDLVKAPIRSALYIVTNNSAVPDSAKFGWDALKHECGYTSYTDSSQYQALDLKFRNSNNNINYGHSATRLTANSVPGLWPLFDKCGWDTTLRPRNLETIATHSPESISVGPSMKQSSVDKIEKARAGLYKDGSHPNEFFHPNESYVLGFLRSVYGTFSTIGQASGGAAGGSGGVSGSGGGAGGGM